MERKENSGSEDLGINSRNVSDKIVEALYNSLPPLNVVLASRFRNSHSNNIARGE